MSIGRLTWPKNRVVATPLMNKEPSTELPIEGEGDIVLARRAARQLAQEVGFGPTDVTRIVTACSEMARNVFKYAGQGKMSWRILEGDSGPGLELKFDDRGPGIADIETAMREGYSSSGGLGMGLPGAKRLMDEFRIDSTIGRGTSVVLKKWLRRP